MVLCGLCSAHFSVICSVVGSFVLCFTGLLLLQLGVCVYVCLKLFVGSGAHYVCTDTFSWFGSLVVVAPYL